MGTQALDGEGQAGLGLQRFGVAVGQRVVQPAQAPGQGAVAHRGVVHRPADVLVAQHRRLEVEHLLAEPVGHGRTPVVGDVRRQHGHDRAVRAVVVALEPVADRPLVDQEHRPGVVGVGRVGVVDEPGVEHLALPVERGPPGPDLLAGADHHARNVRDVAAGSDVLGPMPENSPTKLAVAVRDDLATWQKLNVTAFLVSGIGTRHPDLVGEPYVDGVDVSYLPMFAHPVLVYAAGDAAALARAADRARARGLTMAVYTDDLFTTGNDVDNRAAVRHVPTEKLALAGIAVAGPRRDVDKALDRLRLHA